MSTKKWMSRKYAVPLAEIEAIPDVALELADTKTHQWCEANGFPATDSPVSRSYFVDCARAKGEA